MFPPDKWLPRVWEAAALDAPLGSVVRCNWSYQWAEHDMRGARHCDVVLEYEDSRGRGVLVVEAKRPKSRLRAKDLNPDYYLSIPDVAAFDRRSLIYLLDDEACRTEPRRVTRGTHDIGFLSWTQLAAIQLAQVARLPLSGEIQAFLAGSIYATYMSRGVTPRQPPLAYLCSEPSCEDVIAKRAKPLGKGDWSRPLWRLDS